MSKFLKKICGFLPVMVLFCGILHALPVEAVTVPNLKLSFGAATSPEQVSMTLQILILLTVLTLAPAILVMMTSFVRIIVVLSFLRQAIGTHQVPPNQVLVGLALFLTFFIMTPVWTQVNRNALQPYLHHELSQGEAFDRAMVPIRKFLFHQTREKDLALCIRLSGEGKPKNRKEVKTIPLLTAFVMSELKTAFQIGFMIYIPFLVLDMVVASILLSMGMMMLPPVIVSLPFKLMLFVLVDGWYMIVESLIKSFGTM
ncbi:MAG: flagellar type III secretion system pore protein FliP [Deltaproteobacteria bacterium]|nr:flagellar type III secretion system pore protein FliP [Deltaproteobacteria bacterium]